MAATLVHRAATLRATTLVLAPRSPHLRGVSAPIELERRNIASFDGTPLQMQLFGRRGAPLVLLANGLGATVMAYRFVLARFAKELRFVSWDYRGLYGSGRPVGGYQALTVEHHARDALAVLEAVYEDEGRPHEHHALGWSMGVQVLLELQRHAPASTRSLILHNGVPGRPWSTLGGRFDSPLRFVVDPLLAGSQRLDGLLHQAVRRAVDWRGFVPTAIRLGLVHHELRREVFHDVAQGFKLLDMHLYIEQLRQLGRHDAFDVLPLVRCATLILQGTADLMTPMVVAQRMAHTIPAAELVLIPGGTHYAAVEMPELINDELERFWGAHGVFGPSRRAEART
jgi:pimeloyl-ACP methyl ester carboxylesterase